MILFSFCIVFILGAAVGSFLNVVILRAFSGESIVLPPSKCPQCKEKIKPWDNIPILSYLFLKGKCRHCKAKISPQYPLVELFTAIIFTFVYYRFGFTLNTIFLMIASSLFIVMSVTDIKEKVVFDRHAYILAALGLIYNFLNIAGENTTKIKFFIAGWDIAVWQVFIFSVLGLIFGVIAMESISRLSSLIIKKRAFGEGDSYIVGALGAFFGIANLIVILILSVIIQIALFLPIYIQKLFQDKQYRLLISLFLFAILTVLLQLGERYGLFRSMTFYWFTFALFACIGIYCIKNIVKSIKEGNNLTYFPFGPALIIAAFLVMFV